MSTVKLIDEAAASPRRAVFEDIKATRSTACQTSGGARHTRTPGTGAGRVEGDHARKADTHEGDHRVMAVGD